MPTLLTTKRNSRRKSSQRNSRKSSQRNSRKSSPFKDVNSMSDLTQWLYNHPSIALQLFTSVFSMYKSTTNSAALKTLKTILEENTSHLKTLKKTYQDKEDLKEKKREEEKKKRQEDEEEAKNQRDKEERDRKDKETRDEILSDKKKIEQKKKELSQLNVDNSLSSSS